MIDKEIIKSKLFGLVGFQNPANPEYAIVDSSNEASSTGRYFTDNNFCKIESIRDTQDYSDIDDAAFNVELAKIQNESITTIADQVFNEPDFIDRQILFQNANNKLNTESLPGGFAGYRIYVDKEKNLAFEIKRIILEFSGTGDIELVLFNSAKTTPLYTETVSIIGSFQEVELNWVVNNPDYYKGEFYFGYFTDGLTVTPYKRDYQAANIKSCVTYLNIENIKVTTATAPNIFNLNDVDGADQTWGLNPDITTYYDYTDLIVNNKRLFAQAIQLQGQIRVLNQYLATLASNRNERISNEYINRIVIELEGYNGQDLKRIGLKATLIREVTRLREEVLKLQSGYLQKGIISVTRC